MSLAPAERRLLRDQVYESLRDAIVAGTLTPGATLHEGELAAQLGVSRAPVRDAVARLGADGLVQTKPQSWTRVTPLDDSAVRDAVVVVRTMHELAARVAAPRLTSADLADMADLNARFEQAVAMGDLDGAIVADDAFHDVPLRVAGNAAVIATAARYTPLIRRLERHRFAEVPGRESVRLHAQLLAAFRARDVEAAVHITSTIWWALEQQLAPHLDGLM